MAKTANVNFPAWGAMESGLRLDTNSYTALYVGDQLTVDTVGAVYSIVAVISPDSLSTSGQIMVLTPSLAGAGTFPLALTEGYILGVGFRQEDFDLFIEVGSNPVGGIYDSVSKSHVSATTGKVEPFEVDKPIHICVTMEIVAIVGNEITEVKMSLYLNGDLQLSDLNNPIGWLTTANTPQFLLMQKDMVVGSVKLYDKILSAEQVRQDFLLASQSDFVNFTDITNLTITDVAEQEFNNTFGPTNNVLMSSNTQGSFTLGDARAVSSFIEDPLTGLPTAGDAHFGAYITLGVESHATEYKLDQFQIATSGNVGTVLCFAYFDPDTVFGTIPTAGEEVFINGVIGGETSWSSYNGFQTIQTVTLAPYYIISFEPTWDGISLPSSYFSDLASDASIRLSYPKSFDAFAEVPGTNLEPSTVFTTDRLEEEYTVRVRGVTPEGKTSKWLEGSSISQADLSKPNAVYLTIHPQTDATSMTGLFDFGKDLSGAVDSSFHTETNLSHIELTVCHADTDRDSAVLSPGEALPEKRYTVSGPISLTGPPEQVGFSLAAASILITGSGDYYAWGRVITTAGVASDWFPNDTGLSADRTYPTSNNVPIGLGPIRVESGVGANLVPNSTSVSTAVDTGTSDPEGPGSSGSGGVFL